MDGLEQSVVVSQLPPEYQEQIEQYSTIISEIETVFSEQGISESDTQLAITIYLSYLTGFEKDESFYFKYANCFINTGVGTSVLDNITTVFGVTFSDDDMDYFNKFYGG